MKVKVLALAVACWVGACNGVPAEAVSVEPNSSNVSVQADAEATGDSSLPADACTTDGFWSFLEVFARSPGIRDAYTEASARSAINPFRIALSDNQWSYVDGERTPPARRLALSETRKGESIRVDYAVAEFGPDDEVLSRPGPSGVYEFRFVDGCWRLVE